MNPSGKTVLLVTHSRDHFTVDRVAEALARHRAKVFRLNTDRFPREVRLSGRFESEVGYFEIQDGGESLRSDEVSAVWLRRVSGPDLSDELDPKFRDVCISES